MNTNIKLYVLVSEKTENKQLKWKGYGHNFAGFMLIQIN